VPVDKILSTHNHNAVVWLFTPYYVHVCLCVFIQKNVDVDVKERNMVIQDPIVNYNITSDKKNSLK